MPAAEVVFWVAAGVIAYPYLLYPLWLALRGWLGARPVRRQQGLRLSVSFVTCAHNEAGRIERRLNELTGILRGTGIPGEVVVVSDGSTDGTSDLVSKYSSQKIRLVELPRRAGKAAALTAGAAAATGEVLVFCDVRQTWAPDALELLLENFADDEVGAVSGDLFVISGPGAVEGVGLYWKLEKWMRRQESRAGSQVGVTGAVCAVRRELFAPIPAGTLLDDVYWPLRVAMRGRRVIHDSRALAYDRLPERAGDEFRRKVRTLAGNFQLLTRLPAALLPWRNPTWFVFLSHKLARLAVPWALLGLLVSASFADGPIYLGLLLAQLACYALASVGLATARGGKLTSVPASFVMLNAAAWVAFWVWLFGRADRSWVKTTYTNPEVPPALGRQESAGGLVNSIEGDSVTTFVFVALALLTAAAASLAWLVRKRNAGRWLPAYVWQRLRRRGPRRGDEVHVLLCIADHHEPKFQGAPPAVARERVRRWVEDYPRQFGRFRDSDGRPPRHTFFYPIEEYEPEFLDALAGLCAAGFGEVEVHLHHKDDTAENLRDALTTFTDVLANRHGLLGRDRLTGEPRYAFIHGNWTLCNSDPRGRWCGVNNELEVLRQTGCVVDMTLPSAPSPAQTPTINSIYYAADQPGRPRSHDRGVEVGTAERPDNGLLLIQGPLMLNWARRKWGLLPRLENGCLQASQPPTLERLWLWLRAAVQVRRRPDWYFVKLHCHGSPEDAHEVLLGGPMVRFHQALAEHARQDPNFHYHYVTAREMYNLTRAAEAGWGGDVAGALGYELSPPPFAGRGVDGAGAAERAVGARCD